MHFDPGLDAILIPVVIPCDVFDTNLRWHAIGRGDPCAPAHAAGSI
jgi:hypothetical protein